MKHEYDRIDSRIPSYHGLDNDLRKISVYDKETASKLKKAQQAIKKDIQPIIHRRGT